MNALSRWWFTVTWGCEPHTHRMERIAANTRACVHVDTHGRRCNGWDGVQAWI